MVRGETGALQSPKDHRVQGRGPQDRCNESGSQKAKRRNLPIGEKVSNQGITNQIGKCPWFRLTVRRQARKMKSRKMKTIEIYFVALFAIILLTSILFALVLNMPHISLALLLIEFPIAGITVVYASLSIREEEEEKSKAST